MLKISLAAMANSMTTFRLEGRLIGPWVAELRQICEPLIRDGTTLVMDLNEVTYADENGLALLASLRTRGAQLLNPMPFVGEQLRADSQLRSERS